MDLPVKFLGRPIKPVTAGLSWAAGVFVIAGVVDISILGSGWPATLLGLIAVIVVAMFTISWLRLDQRLLEIGLLVATFMFVARSMFVGLTVGFDKDTSYLALSNAIIAGGSYMLEKINTREAA